MQLLALYTMMNTIVTSLSRLYPLLSEPSFLLDMRFGDPPGCCLFFQYWKPNKKLFKRSAFLSYHQYVVMSKNIPDGGVSIQVLVLATIIVKTREKGHPLVHSQICIFPE